VIEQGEQPASPSANKTKPTGTTDTTQTIGFDPLTVTHAYTSPDTHIQTRKGFGIG